MVGVLQKKRLLYIFFGRGGGGDIIIGEDLKNFLPFFPAADFRYLYIFCNIQQIYLIAHLVVIIVMPLQNFVGFCIIPQLKKSPILSDAEKKKKRKQPPPRKKKQKREMKTYISFGKKEVTAFTYIT